jgi:hypothetical protein
MKNNPPNECVGIVVNECLSLFRICFRVIVQAAEASVGAISSGSRNKVFKKYTPYWYWKYIARSLLVVAYCLLFCSVFGVCVRMCVFVSACLWCICVCDCV